MQLDFSYQFHLTVPHSDFYHCELIHTLTIFLERTTTKINKQTADPKGHQTCPIFRNIGSVRKLVLVTILIKKRNQGYWIVLFFLNKCEQWACNEYASDLDQK